VRTGDLVRLDPAIFDRLASSRPDGSLSQYDIDVGRYPACRNATEEEAGDWMRSTAAKGTPPRTVTIFLRKDRFYTVTKSASTAMVSAGRTQVLCSITGEEVYVKRDKLILA
jgi:hypothetical protein